MCAFSHSTEDIQGAMEAIKNTPEFLLDDLDDSIMDMYRE